MNLNTPSVTHPSRDEAGRTVHVGTAGWSIPQHLHDIFAAGPSALARYASRFDCVEINSSFHRRHRLSTWRRWAESVPEHFRFSVKIPKTITHEMQLNGCAELLQTFAGEVAGLGKKLGAVLIQLPPSLQFDAKTAEAFFAELRQMVEAPLACEPRHASWFYAEADDYLCTNRIARVAADPAKVALADVPGGWQGFAYWRLHGSPHVYRSTYEPDRIARYASAIGKGPQPSWCFFDNTAASFATPNALELAEAFSLGSELTTRQG